MLLGLLCGLGAFLVMDHQVVRAVDEEPKDVFGRAYPRGLSSTQSLFTLGNISYNSTEFYTPSDGNGTTAIIITPARYNRVGSVWSNMAADNYIDLSKRQTMSMWLYFGARYYNGGDGMAFVMQNDPRGVSAFAQGPGGSSIGGETLGVWGSTQDGSTPEVTASRAIQNSWALEFDTYLNPKGANPANDNKFDINLGLGDTNYNNHIASNYPGEVATYNTDLSMNHEGLVKLGDVFSSTIDKILSNVKWRHLKMQWDPTTQEMTYIFDDENFDVDGQANGSPSGKAVTRTVPIDISKLNLTDGNTKVRWGFTGSTGSASENNFVIFESIPSLVEAEATAEIQNVTQGRTVASGDAVIAGDTLDVHYQLSYLSGNQSWQNIVASLSLPKSMTYTTAQITYPNTDKPAETIDVSKLSNFAMSQTLGQALDSSVARADIHFIGTAKAGTLGSTATVPSAVSTFKGTNLIATAATNNFVIKSAKPLTIATTVNTVNIQQGDDAVLGGTMAYTSGGTIDNTKVTLYTKLNEATTETGTLASVESSTNGTYKITVPAEGLKPGVNILTVYARDADGNKSNTITYTINMTGYLVLKATPAVTFERGFAGDTHQILDRQGDWTVTLEDTRTSGSKWAIQATASQLMQTTTPLNGDIIYVDINSNQTAITDNPTTVASGTKMGDDPTTTDISTGWVPTTGLFLNTTGNNNAGIYTGTITWTATNSI